MSSIKIRHRVPTKPVDYMAVTLTFRNFYKVYGKPATLLSLSDDDWNTLMRDPHLRLVDVPSVGVQRSIWGMRVERRHPDDLSGISWVEGEVGP